MENGRAATLEPHDPLAREPYLAVAEIAGSAGAARILLAAPLSMEDIEGLGGLATTIEAAFDPASAALRARSQRRYRRLVLSEAPAALVLEAGAARALARGLAGLGLSRLPWTPSQRQWRERVAFLRAAEGEEWPDLSDAALAASVEDWLAPAIEGRRGLADITPADLDRALAGLLPASLARRIEAEAPTHFLAPTGSRLPIDYGAEGGPTVSVRLQELFGLGRHPSIAGGRVPLTLALLSPAHRPVQVTRDLPGFWSGSYAAVRSEMRGRYPKHPWPDDPRSAPPTTRAKRRGE
jgi:ATP-dependent helicase HrpB